MCLYGHVPARLCLPSPDLTLPSFPLAGSKLLLIVRHGQAVSNWLSDSLGPDEWFGIEEKCAYTDNNATTWGVFDAGGDGAEYCVGAPLSGTDISLIGLGLGTRSPPSKAQISPTWARSEPNVPPPKLNPPPPSVPRPD